MTSQQDDPPGSALAAGQVELRYLVGGLSSPLGIVNAGDDTNRLFVLEKRGTVRVIEDKALKPGFFLDLRGVVGGLSTSSERGLLGLAFHPDFKTNRYLFAYYTDAAATWSSPSSGRTRTARRSAPRRPIGF